MNKFKRTKIVAFIMLCVPFCGGWAAVPAAQRSDRYVGGELIATYATETIPYVSKQVLGDNKTVKGVPSYFSVNGMENACGAVAGAIVVGFYDKYYENLIPGWTPAYSSGLFKMQDKTYVPALLQDLYTSMQTNVVAPGVSEDECKNGLSSYVSEHGYSLSYTSLGNGNNFNYSAFCAAVDNNQVSILFVQPSNYYIYDTSSDNEDRLTSGNINGNHIMVAYGYYEVQYTLTNGTRTDRYLRIATGYYMNSNAFYKIGSYIDAAYQVKIV